MTSDQIIRSERRGALLDAWVETQRKIARLQAEAAALLAERWELWAQEVADAPMQRDMIERSMFAEYAAAGHMSQGSAEFAFVDARLLHEEFPTIREAFTDGRLTPQHVREILRESRPVREAVRTGDVDAGTLKLYEVAVLEVAEADTAARTRAHARRVAAALAGTTVVDQHERAAADREVTVRSVGDGMALLQAMLPEHLALAIQDRLTVMARHMVRHSDDRRPILPPTEPTDAEWAAQRAEAEWAEAIFSAGTFTTDPFTTDPFTTARLMTATPSSTDPSGAQTSTESETSTGFEKTNTDFETSARPAPEADPESDPHRHEDSPLLLHLPADDRTMDQLRADLFADLLLASAPSEVHGTGLEGIHATIQVTVAASTLAGADDRPAELDGHGPLHPDVARALAGSRTGWTRLFLSPAGLVEETDTYTPTEPMRRFLRARDQHCRFPGCRMPVHRCDIDHNHDHAAGGPTAIGNLAHLCRSHHALKHPDVADTARWTVTQLADQTLRWHSPTGRTYPDRVPRRVMFVDADTRDLPTCRPAGNTAGDLIGAPF
ncbi:HNH endonuclease signature motif containing protein [Microbacterium soli]|uniref:HNH nuclease domain-containing protein n=1 Tax=Microbacterium soli TaxID=446075 RepID=A0ABP7NDZ3_9MICO